MRRLLQSAFVLSGLLGLQAAHAAPVTINFDTLANGTTVTNQFPEATFSSNAGFRILTTAQNFGSSLPNFICTAANTSGIDCTHDVFVSFTAPVSALSFVFVGDDNAGAIGLVDIFDITNSLLGTVNVVGDANPGTPGTVNLGAFSNVGRIAIRNITDGAGLGFDDFKFATDAVVPEPTSVALVGLALAAAGYARRRQA